VFAPRYYGRGGSRQFAPLHARFCCVPRRGRRRHARLPRVSWGEFSLSFVALLVVVVVGTLGFHWILGEDFVSSLYRVVVTVSLSGLDTKPSGHGGELFTVAVLVAGGAIFSSVPRRCV